MSKTFVNECLSGRALLDDVDDWIDEWHESDTDLSLDSFLGFSDDEGALFAERPDALRFIVAARRQHVPVAKVLATRDNYALAARAGDSERATAVLAWLRETGRL